jgi:hypothetical protein
MVPLLSAAQELFLTAFLMLSIDKTWMITMGTKITFGILIR